MPTKQVLVMIDYEDGDAPADDTLALAVYRAIEYALEADIAGTDCLNAADVGQVSCHAFTVDPPCEECERSNGPNYTGDCQH